jgi:hypothetical protein
MSDTSAGSSGRGRHFDPRKRVNYMAGIALGVDEFVQDQLHLRARDHRGVSALHGYGTVSGLGVRWNRATGQIRVAPGLAVDPAGRLVCVPTEQCIDLSEWLTEHRAAIVSAVGGDEAEDLPDELRLYVALRYRQRETDLALLLSESCRPAEQSRAASRLLDSFELCLLLAPPAPTAELIGDALAESVGRLRNLAAASDAAADGGDGGKADTSALRRELVAWATTPHLDLTGRVCSDEAPGYDCGEHPGEPSAAVLLAHIDLGLGNGVEDVDYTPIDAEVDESDRPVLLTTRYLQEWLTELVAHPGRSSSWDHSLLEKLDADDHPHYLPTDGSRPLTGTLNAGHNVILNLRRSNGPTHAMRRDEIVGFDLDRTPDGLQITALQGELVEASGAHAPREGDVLRYDGQRWVPSALTTPGVESPAPDTPAPPRSAIRSVLPFVTIERLGRGQAGATFLLWFGLEALDTSEVLAPVDGDQPLLYGENVEIFTERCDDGQPRLRRVASNRVQIARVGCNVFRVDILREEAEYLRFRFHTSRMRLESGVLLETYAAERGITWVGQSDNGTVTKFVLNPTLGKPFEGFEDVKTVVAPGGGAKVALESR